MQLAFMSALWELGEGSVAEVHGALERQGKSFAPTTVATVLRRMENKGLVKHRRQGRQFLYRTERSRDELQGSVISRLSRSLYGGKVGALLCQLVDSEEVTADELAEVKRLIEAKEKEINHD